MAANDHSRRRTSLYVSDLHPEVTEKDLAETFARAGPLLSVHLCRDEFSRKSLCYAYVNFWLPCHALTALKCLNHTILRGKSIRIMWYEKDPITRKNRSGNLFVKNLDQSITSARLQEIFSNYGTILSCKVVEENGISKGFGFVQFDSEDSAMAALNAFHDTELEGKKLYVSKFLKKIERKDAELGFRSLHVKNLDEDITEDRLKDKFSEHGNVSSAVIMKDGKGKSRGFGYVNFDSHEGAKKAMEVLNGELIGSKNLIVGRAQTKAERIRHFRQIHGYNCADHCKESKASNLYVKNLDASVDDKKLEELFSGYGKVISAKVIRNGGVSKGFGFVCFSCPDEAKKALISLNGANFEGRILYVAVARPKEQQTSKLHKSCVKFPPQPIYTSKSQQPQCNFPHFSSPIPFNQPSPFHPTLYQYSVSPFKSFNPFQAQNFQGSFYDLPMLLSTLNGNRQHRYLEMWKGKKSSSRLQGKITNGEGKELCKGSGTMKMYCMRSSPEIHNIKPGYMHHPLIQNLQGLIAGGC